MLGGHSSRIFQSKPSEKFDCPLCYETLRDPLQCSNGHLFCKMCILSVLERKDRCPLCDTCISVSLLAKSLFVQQCIGKLTTFCVSSDSEMFRQSTEVLTAVETCAWTGPLHARNHHFETECQYFPMKCDNIGCEVQLLRKTVVEHNDKCLFAHMKCEHCDELYLRHKMADHIDSCEHRPVLCPRNCSAILSFDQVEAHLRNDCPNQKATPSSNARILTDTVSAEIVGCLSGLSIDGDGGKAQETVTAVSKSSKKNAKRAAKRKNPTTSITAVEDTSSGNVTLLDGFVDAFLNAGDRSTSLAERNGRVENTKEFASAFKKMLDLCPPSELDRQLMVLFLTHKNSVANRIRRDEKVDWSLLVAYFFSQDVRCSNWLIEKSYKAVEVSYLFCKVAEITGAKAIMKHFSGFPFTEWLQRREYQASVEITVSGSYDPAADGKYRFSDAECTAVESFAKVDKSTPHVIAVHGSETYSCWSLCILVPNDSLPGEPSFGKLRWLQLYNQGTTPFSPIPSESLPWRCFKSPAHPSHNKMKIVVRRIEM